MEQFSGFRVGFSKIMFSIFSIVTSLLFQIVMFSDPLDCDVFLSLRFSFLILQIVMCSDLTDRNVLQRMVLSLLLQRLQACWANGDHDIQVKPMAMIMNAIMSLSLLLLSYYISY